MALAEEFPHEKNRQSRIGVSAELTHLFCDALVFLGPTFPITLLSLESPRSLVGLELLVPNTPGFPLLLLRRHV